MAIVACPDCGAQVSNQAPDCIRCGRPIAQTGEIAERRVVDVRGAWCPQCGNRDSSKAITNLGCGFWAVVLVTFGLTLLFVPFMGRSWHCRACGHQWKA